MANPENIKPYEYQPGQSGNPNGRPVGSKSISATVRKLLKGKMKLKKNPLTGQDEEGEYTVTELVSMSLVAEALRGNVNAIKELLDRTEGKVATKIEVHQDWESEVPTGDEEVEPDYENMSIEELEERIRLQKNKPIPIDGQIEIRKEKGAVVKSVTRTKKTTKGTEAKKGVSRKSDKGKGNSRKA